MRHGNCFLYLKYEAGILTAEINGTLMTFEVLVGVKAVIAQGGSGVLENVGVTGHERSGIVLNIVLVADFSVALCIAAKS